jgi:enoyl-[acyl-carrier protein] reductase II
MLDIEFPIMLAGMGGVSYHRLVAAVSEAGGLGTLGASTMQAGELEDEIAGVKKLTNKTFGVDLLTALPHTLERDVDLIIKSGAKVFVAGLGVRKSSSRNCCVRKRLRLCCCARHRRRRTHRNRCNDGAGAASC